MFSKKMKRILGRWFEELGIGIFSGAVVTYVIYSVLFWYFLLSGTILALIGACLLENNS